MWVAPEFRGVGLAAALISAVVGLARDEGHRTLSLWVVDGNVAAERAYSKAGFRPTGRRQPVRAGEPAMEFEMALATSRPPRTG